MSKVPENEIISAKPLAKFNLIEAFEIINALFVVRKFWSAYGYPPPTPGLKSVLAGFAQTLVASHFEVAPMLKAMWTSDEFYSDHCKARIVKSPVDFMVGAMKSFSLTNAAPIRVGWSRQYGRAAEDMGMSLFNTPFGSCFSHC